ncbi:MAG: hypothetical protein ACTJGQ_08990, partial [Agrococcus casei]|uniref:hypothetical protein n=1 Tax=Agrococcus casei TaxID=343512 RepID=UPI003F8FED0F
MAPALTPRLSWTMMLVVFLLIAGGELYGAMQQLEWPLHLTGQVQLLVPRLASLAWELLYVYWFLARLTEADRGRRALELTRHGSTVRWLSVTMLRELPYAAAFAFGSGALAVLLRRLMSGEWGGAHAAAALVGSSRGLRQVLVDVVLVMPAVALLRGEHTAV